MLILLDEQLPKQLAKHFIGHNVRTVQQQSWAGLKNGALLGRAEAQGFSVLVTGDQNLQYQQNFTGRGISILVMCAPSNALEDLLPLIPQTLRMLKEIVPGVIVRVLPE